MTPSRKGLEKVALVNSHVNEMVLSMPRKSAPEKSMNRVVDKFHKDD